MRKVVTPWLCAPRGASFDRSCTCSLHARSERELDDDAAAYLVSWVGEIDTARQRHLAGVIGSYFLLIRLTCWRVI